jgi:hypothetical protein
MSHLTWNFKYFLAKLDTANQKIGFLELFSDWLNFKKPKIDYYLM